MRERAAGERCPASPDDGRLPVKYRQNTGTRWYHGGEDSPIERKCNPWRALSTCRHRDLGISNTLSLYIQTMSFQNHFSDIPRRSEPPSVARLYSRAKTLTGLSVIGSHLQGELSHACDTLSEVVSQTDAKGQTTTMTYLLARVTQRVESGLISSWTYDTATKRT